MCTRSLRSLAWLGLTTWLCACATPPADGADTAGPAGGGLAGDSPPGAASGGSAPSSSGSGGGVSPSAPTGPAGGSSAPAPTAPADPTAPAVVGCDGGSAAAQPFGSLGGQVAAGALLPDHVTQEQLNQGVRDVYDQWKSRYLSQACGGSGYLVRTGQANSLTVSEAHGYGMLLAAYMAGHDPEAQAIFDGLLGYFNAHPSVGNSDLMAWSQDDACENNQGAHSATDGDLDVAYALLLADRQWGSGDVDYRSEAARVSRAILWSEADAQDQYMLLGDWVNANDSQFYNATRSSDFMPGHFESFASVVGDEGWTNVVGASYRTLETMQDRYAPTTGLVPDFIADPAGTPAPVGLPFLEGEYDGEYSFNACRVPWRVGVHALTSGDERARRVVQRIDDWLRGATGGDPAAVRSGYWLDGDVFPGRDYRDLAFLGPFAVGAAAAGRDQSWVNALWEALRWDDGGTYYGDSLRLLSMIALSGNWWAPEATPCPE